VNVPYKLREIGILLTEDRFVPVLEERAVAVVPFVKTDRVTGQEPRHHAGKRRLPCPYEQMGVVGEKCPGIAARHCLGQH